MTPDDIRNNLPKEIGINGRDEYFNSVVLLLLIPINGEYHIIFEKRAKLIRQGGEVSFPGGKCDDGDDSKKQTALRETEEELGIPPNKIEILGQMDTVIAPYGVIIDVFVGITHISPDEIKINTDEVEYFFTLPTSFFQNNIPEEYEVHTHVHPTIVDPETKAEIELFPTVALGLPPRYHKPWGDFKTKVYVYTTENEIIWGITARIVRDFVKCLN